MAVSFDSTPLVTGAGIAPVPPRTVADLAAGMSAPVPPLRQPAAPVDEFAQFEDATDEEVAVSAGAVDEFAQFEDATDDEFAAFEDAEDLDVLSPQELVNSPEFNPVQYAIANPEIFDGSNPEKAQKLLEAYRLQRIKGVTLDVVGESLKAAPAVGMEFLKGARDLTSRVIDVGLQPAVNTFLGLFTDPQTRAELVKETKRGQKKAIAEVSAGSETAAFGMANLIRQGKRKFLTSEEDLQKATPEQLRGQLLDDVEFARQAERVVQGRGEAAKFTKLDADTLRKEGIELDEEAIAALSTVDPLTLIGTGGAFAGGFALARKGGQVVLRAPTAAKALAAAKQMGLKVAEKLPSTGQVIQTGGRAVQATGRKTIAAADAAEGTLRGAGAVAGGISGGIAASKLGTAAAVGGLTAGAALGSRAGAMVAQGIRVAGAGVQGTGRGIIAFGKQLTGEVPKGKLFRAVELATAPLKAPAVGATIGGLAGLPIGLAADTDEEAAQLIAGGIALGGGAGVAFGAHRGITSLRERFVGERLLDPFNRENPVVRESPAYGVDPNMDRIHEQGFGELPVDSQAIVNDARQLFRGDENTAGGEIYVQDGDNYAQRIAEILELEKGAPLDAAELAAAQDYASTHAVFSKTIPSPEGPRRVVFLNKDATGLTHDSGHLFQALLPDTEQAALQAEVGRRYTPDEMAAYKKLYEDRLNQDRPDDAPRRQLSPEELADEIIAENFSVMFLNADPSTMGTPRPLKDRLVQSIAAMSERAGIDLSGGRVTPNLRFRPSINLQRMLENAVRQREQQRVGAIPEPEAATPGGVVDLTPEGVRNKRVTPEEQAGTAAPAPDSAGLAVARDFVNRTGDKKMGRVVEDIAAAFERKRGEVSPLEFEVLGAKEAEPGKPTGRLARLEERLKADFEEAAGAAPQDVRDLFQAVQVPVRFETVGKGANQKLQLLGMSLDKVMANVGIVTREAGKRGLQDLIPYDVVTVGDKMHLSPDAWRRFQKDLTAFTENQQNGFRGDGRPLTRPEESLGASIPPENPSFNPTVLPEDVGLFMNLIQGIAPPKTARVTGPGVPGNIKARTIAELNLREVEPPARVPTRDLGKQKFPTGEQIGEVNPLRNELAEGGFPIRDLHEVTERFRVDRIKSVKPRSELQFRAPVTDVTRAGFLPAELDARRVRGAVIRTPRGEMIEGNSHIDAFIKATDEGKLRSDESFEDGFVDGSGEFLTREEAYQRALEIKQAEASDLTKADRLGGQLESQEFAAKARFLPRMTRAVAKESDGIRDTAQFLPTVKVVDDVANAYAKASGISYTPPSARARLRYPRELGKQIADVYEKAQHTPDDPQVREAYDAFKRETEAQAQAILDAGIELEPVVVKDSPYRNAGDAAKDIRDNKRLRFNPSEGGFGEGVVGAEALAGLDNLLLEPSNITLDGKVMNYNDLFRAVHDFFGHGREGFSFGPEGELNAFRNHAELYSDAALPAIGAEALGQTAWTQFGPHLLDETGKVLTPKDPGFTPRPQRPFAEQKNFVMPRELIDQALNAPLDPNLAKFLPDEAPDIVSEVSRLGADDFKKAMDEAEGGLTGLAVRVGKEFKTPEQLEILRTLEDLAKDEMRAALKEGRMDDAMILASKPQFFREARESATSTGSIAAAEARGDFAPAKFLPRTDAGKELAKRFGFREKALPRGERLLELTDLDTSDVAATVSYILGEGREPAIESVLVDPAYRGQDIAQGLLREVFARAQDAGEVEVGSLPGIIDPAMIAVREKVAPGRNAFEDFRTEEPFADAREAQDFFRDPDNKFPLVTAVTDIQGIQFLPREKGKATEKLPLPMKAFIEPDGKFTKVTDATHDDFLIGNADKYNKKFGTKIPKTQGKEDVRIGALNKGFVRIAYEPNNGRLTYEANAKTFSRKQADKIFEHVADNLDSIDNITVALLDEKGNVVKTASRKFFLMDDDAAKLDAIPFVTDEGRPDSPRTVGAFAPRRLLNDETFPAEIEKIARGDKDGETFNVDGTIFNPGDEALDVVTVASVNLPVSQLTPTAVVAALKPFRELMGNENVKPGLFRIARRSPEGEEQVSVDVNAVVPQKFRENTLAFARKNNQESFFDLAKFETVDSGGDGNTVLTDPVQIAEAVDRLAAGKPYTFPKPTLPDPKAFPDTIEVPAQLELETGVAASRPAILGRLQRAALTQAQLKEHFPEAIVPKRGAKIDNDITKSPLYRQHKTEPARVNAFADKLEALFRQHESDPEAQAGLRWYDDFTPRLKERYGEDAQVFAELLAATSPNTTARANFHFADAAFKRWKAGEFDAIISKYQEGLNKLADGSLLKDFEKSGAPQPKKISDSTLMRWWIDEHDLTPTQRPRQTPEGPVSPKFGMHTIAVLKVITRQWLNDNLGLKTNNFVRNLLGTSEEATIDLWAARTMREAGYKGFKDRWRILTGDGRTLRDPDFLFSQKVFAEVARRVGLKASQVQGALWFVEKKRWADRGWSELNLGDYRAELDRIARRDAEISIPDPQGEFFNE